MAQPVRTLDQARAAGLSLIAICRNLTCRHSRPVDLRRVAFTMGGGSPLLPAPGRVHFSDRMRCPLCGERGMFVWPIGWEDDSPAYPDQFLYSVRSWHGESLLMTIARVRQERVAHATYEAAIGINIRDRITLQEGIRVVRDSRFAVLKGGKS